MPIPRLEPERTVLLAVDLQPKLLGKIDGGEAVARRAATLVRGCQTLGVPAIVTEQYPEKLGATAEPVAEALPDGTEPIGKMKFSACVQEVRRRLEELARPTVLLCGIEAHVCVMQTALDLLAAGYRVAYAADAVGSRAPTDRQAGLRRMEGAGVIPASVEMALLEMAYDAATERFKALLPLLK